MNKRVALLTLTLLMLPSALASTGGHVARLTQSITQLALPQMTEEEKDELRHWWQFRRMD